MTCGERNRLVEKEQLGPAAAGHHVALPALVVEDTNQPCLGCPALFQQRLGRRIVDDPSVADEETSLWYRHYIAKRGYAVL
jgi:hypothetical protein